MWKDSNIRIKDIKVKMTSILAYPINEANKNMPHAPSPLAMHSREN